MDPGAVKYVSIFLQISQSVWMKSSMLSQLGGLLTLVLDIYCENRISRERKSLCLSFFCLSFMTCESLSHFFCLSFMTCESLSLFFCLSFMTCESLSHFFFLL